jgi:S1-C subfamily serine protease
VKVTFNTGRTLPARVVGADTADDLAVLHVAATGLHAAHFAAAGTYQVAQTVLAIGNPLDLQQTVTSGLISALGRTVQEASGAYLPDAIQTSAPINPGNSGGALVTLAGDMIGIPTLEAVDPQNNNGGAAQGIGFAVPSPRITAVVQQIIATGHVIHTGRAYLGVSIADASTTSDSGAIVRRVTAGGPAARAGLQPGDVITAANGQPIGGTTDLLMALAHSRPGTTMTFTVDRNGTKLTVHALLGELPAS